MREILFRGKRLDNGEWVVGFHFCMVHDDNRHVHHFIMPLGADLSSGTTIEKIQVEVDQETVCQYTGLADKYGMKIFEGDIIEDIDYGRMRCMYKRGSFIWYNEDGFEIKFMTYIPTIEVIGNVFDNPLLAK